MKEQCRLPFSRLDKSRHAEQERRRRRVRSLSAVIPIVVPGRPTNSTKTPPPQQLLFSHPTPPPPLALVLPPAISACPALPCPLSPLQRTETGNGGGGGHGWAHAHTYSGWLRKTHRVQRQMPNPNPFAKNTNAGHCKSTSLSLAGNERAASPHGNYAASTTPCSLIQPPARPSASVRPPVPPSLPAPVALLWITPSLPLECAPATAPTECRPPSPRSPPTPLTLACARGREGRREGRRRQAAGTCCARFVLGRSTRRRQPCRVGMISW